jgi:hypothetical protein
MFACWHLTDCLTLLIVLLPLLAAPICVCISLRQSFTNRVENILSKCVTTTPPLCRKRLSMYALSRLQLSPRQWCILRSYHRLVYLWAAAPIQISRLSGDMPHCSLLKTGYYFSSFRSMWSPNWVHSACRPLTGLLYLPRVIVRMENLVEWMAGETKVLGETLPRRHFVHHKSQLTRTRDWTRAAAVGSQRLTASAMARPFRGMCLQHLLLLRWFFPSGCLFSTRSILSL